MFKKWLLLFMIALLAYPQSAKADDKEQRQEPYLADLLLIPAKGQILSQFTYINTNVSQNVSFSNSVYNFKETDKDSDLGFSLLYGVSDKLSFGVDLKYGLSKDANIDYASSSATDYSTTAKGLYDPALNLMANLFGNPNSNFMGNIKLSVSPNVIDAKTATKNNDGTLGKGGTDVTFGIDIGTPLKTSQLAILLSYTMRSDRAKKDADGNYETNYSGGNSLNATVAGQIFLTSGVTGLLFYSFENVDSTEIKGKALNSSYLNYTEKDGRFSASTFGAGLSYELTKNNLIGFIYKVGTANNVDFDYSSSTTSLSGTVKDISANQMLITWVSRF